MEKLVYRLLGANRFKHRGDCFFLGNDFGRALREYRRARSALSSSDYRVATLDALIRECSSRIGESPYSEDGDLSEEEPPYARTDRAESSFVPGLADLFELAISEKPSERSSSYRGLGDAFQAGYVSLVQGDAHAAIRQLELAARKAPASFILQLELGRALSLGGEMERAREELAKAVQMNPNDRELLNVLAAVNIQLGRFEEAAGQLEPLATRDGVGPETIFLLGRAAAGMGRFDEALQRFRETVEMDARFHEAFFEGAKILKDRGDYSNALRLLNRACSLVPDEVTYNLEMAKFVLDHELDEEIGLAACDRLMVTDEDNQWQYLSWIAELYLRRGWRREARDPMRKALKLIPSHRTEDRLALERRLAGLDGQLANPEPRIPRRK